MLDKELDELQLHKKTWNYDQKGMSDRYAFSQLAKEPHNCTQTGAKMRSHHQFTVNKMVLTPMQSNMLFNKELKSLTQFGL